MYSKQQLEVASNMVETRQTCSLKSTCFAHARPVLTMIGAFKPGDSFIRTVTFVDTVPFEIPRSYTSRY